MSKGLITCIRSDAITEYRQEVLRLNTLHTERMNIYKHHRHSLASSLHPSLTLSLILSLSGLVDYILLTGLHNMQGVMDIMSGKVAILCG